MAWLWRRPARPKLLSLRRRGRKLFPSRGARSRLPPARSSRREPAPPPSTCPGFAADLGGTARSPHRGFPCCFLWRLSPTRPSRPQRCQQRAWRSRPAWSTRGRGEGVGAAGTIPVGVRGGGRGDPAPGGPAPPRLPASLPPRGLAHPLLAPSPSRVSAFPLRPGCPPPFSLPLCLLDNRDSVSRGPAPVPAVLGAPRGPTRPWAGRASLNLG